MRVRKDVADRLADHAFTAGRSKEDNRCPCCLELNALNSRRYQFRAEAFAIECMYCGVQFDAEFEFPTEGLARVTHLSIVRGMSHV